MLKQKNIDDMNTLMSWSISTENLIKVPKNNALYF